MRRLALNPDFRALWAEGGLLRTEIDSLRRKLEDDADRDVVELTRLRSRLSALHYVREAVERGSEEPKEQPMRRAERPKFLSRFLPRTVGG